MAAQSSDGGVRPLDDVRVVEVSSYMASPSAGALLSDLGADVVKIEPLTGDPVRGIARPAKVTDPGAPRVDHSFQLDNRGKRSIALDLARDEGQQVLRRLVSDAHVFVCNLLPHRQARFGLTPAELFEVNPSLVHATLTGYGTTGPEAWRPGYDVTAFFGRASISDGQIEADGPPPLPRPAQGDHTTGVALVAGILASLRLAERTGEGQAIETSLLHAAAWSMATELAPTLIDHRQPRRRDRHHQVSALTNRYPCRDDRWIMLCMPEPHWWARFCKAVDRPELADDPRYETLKARYDRMPEVVDLLDGVFATRDRDEWGRIFDENGLIWGPIQSQAELVVDPQAEAAGLWTEIVHPEAGRFPTVAIPIRIDGVDLTPRGAAPDVGQHTAEVLGAAGYDAADIDALRDAGVIG